MGLAKIVEQLYFNPWLIRTQTHRAFGRLLDSYLHGVACDPAMFAPREMEATIQDGVAIIPIQGPLGLRLSPMEQSLGALDFLDAQETLRDVAADDAVKSIVLWIDSPGGMVNGTMETADVIDAIGKPIVAFSDSVMASAAYWLGARARHIVATKSADVGSVGVYMAVLDESRAYELEGLSVELIKAGKLKGMGYPGTSLDKAQKAHLQAEVDVLHDQFRAAVRDMRPVKDEHMEGQTLTGEAAKEAGLIEQVGTIEDAIAAARDMQTL